MSVKKNIYQSTVSGQIQDIAKPFTSVEGQKKKKMGKNNPVYISHSYSNITGIIK